jgi:hypothetical protein
VSILSGDASQAFKMSSFNMHSIKRQARKEAWYGDSYNPFRKTTSSNRFKAHTAPALVGRTSSWSPDVSAPSALRAESPVLEHTVSDEILPNRVGEDSGARGHARSDEKVEEPESAAVDQERPVSPAERARSRFIGKFAASKKDEDSKFTSDAGDVGWKFSDYSEEELSWDPFGALSESIAELPLYPTSNATAFKIYAHAAQQRYRKTGNAR